MTNEPPTPTAPAPGAATTTPPNGPASTPASPASTNGTTSAARATSPSDTTPSSSAVSASNAVSAGGARQAKLMPAGRIAALVAVPVALVVGVAAFQFLKPAGPHGNSSEPVKTTVRQLSAADAAACGKAFGQFPQEIRGLTRRPVTNGPEQNAAYGDPAVTVACGGSIPSFPADDFLYVIDGVCWHPDAGGNTWVTVDRTVPVTLTLTEDLAGNGSAQWAAPLSGIVRESIPQSEKMPTGCKPG